MISAQPLSQKSENSGEHRTGQRRAAQCQQVVASGKHPFFLLAKAGYQFFEAGDCLQVVGGDVTEQRADQHHAFDTKVQNS